MRMRRQETRREGSWSSHFSMAKAKPLETARIKAKGKRYSVGSAPLSSTYLCCEDIGHKSTRVVAVRFFPCLVSTNSSLNLLFHRGKC